MPRFFIRQFTKPGDVVFDAWSGRGTVALEALLNDRIGIGNDRAPDAYTLTKAKVNPITLKRAVSFLDSLESEAEKVELDEELTELDRKAEIFYSAKTFGQLRIIRELLKEDTSNEANFIKAVMLGLLHGKATAALSLTCSHSYSMSPNYVKKYAKEHKLRRPTKDVISELKRRSEIVLKSKLPKLRGKAYRDDSRKLSLDDESVNMIFSSPPYFNVQTYAWCNWLRLWFLGYDYREVRKDLCESGSEKVYADFMKASLAELYRVLKDNGRCFIVAGDVTIGRDTKKLVNTIEFLTPIFEETGFTLEHIFTDSIPSGKRVLTYIEPTEGVKTERIAFLRK